MDRHGKHKIAWIAAALSIHLSSCGIPQAGADSIADIKAQSIQSGIKRISANAAVYPTYTMLDTITVEYSDEIVLPDSDPKTLYTFTDDEAGGKTREVTAVYMNNQREINKGENQSSGRFVIIQLSRVENPEPDESEPWQPESTAGMALHFQSSSYLHTLRTDYSGVKIRQNFDVLNARGQTVQPSCTLPVLRSENVGWPEFQGFSINNVLQGKDGDVHYSVYIPEDYNHEKRYPMIIVLPGYNGLLHSLKLETIGVNLFTDRSSLVWTEQPDDMIVVSPQLEDWGEKSARQVIELTEYFLETYSVDSTRVYAMGYSAGGETMSRVLNVRSDLYSAYLHCSSKWNGDFSNVIENRLPIYFFMAGNDEYYGSEQTLKSYTDLRNGYADRGLTENEIKQLTVINMPDNLYFNRQGIYNYHAGGQYAVNDRTIVRWLLSQHKQ